jgi:hypothetical protein
MAQTVGVSTIDYGTRAEQLAIVYLTRRNDLEVLTGNHRTNIASFDIIVNIHDTRMSAKQFAVEVKARLDPTDRNLLLRDALQRARYLKPNDIPSCLFFFAMRNDEGYYAWLREPKVNPDGKPVLKLADPEKRMRNQPLLKPLDNDAIGEIVTRVSEWYELKHRS